MANGRPSTKARTVSYHRLRRMFIILNKLTGFWAYQPVKELAIDYLGWKHWITTHTPACKRGGPKFPTKRKKNKKKDRQCTVR